MRDYDEMVARMVEQDGVRMTSGQHITTPTAEHLTVSPDMPWYSHQCCATREHDLCPLRYQDGRLCSCRCHSRPVEMTIIDREFPDDPDARDPWIDRRDHYDR